MIRLLFAFLTVFCLVYQTSQAQFSQPGDLDTTFNFGHPHSTFTSSDPFPGNGAGVSLNSSTIFAIAVQPDGKVLIGGQVTRFNGTYRNRIARLNSDGSVDSTFNPGTGVGGTVVNAIALQTNGKVLIGGVFSSFNGTPRNGIARLNADGSLDTTFNPGSGANIVNTIVVQTDGRILVGGVFTTFNGVARNRIARLNTDGSLDTTFNLGTAANGAVNSIILQADGKILLGGFFNNYNGIARNNIVRLHTDGSLDSTFIIGSGSSSQIQTIVLQTDGKILIGGGFASFNGVNRYCIARLNANGSLDTTFNPGTMVSGTVYTIAAQVDGKVLIGGFFNIVNGTSRNHFARLHANGSLDTAFNSVGEINARLSSIRILANGKMLVGGAFSVFNSVSRFCITGLEADGRVDKSFNPVTGSNGVVLTSSLQSDGRAIIGGTLTRYDGEVRIGVARLNAQGSVDTTFIRNNGSGSVHKLAIQVDGKVLVGGSYSINNGMPNYGIVRLDTNGIHDTTFNVGLGTNTRVLAIVTLVDGSILIGGEFTSFNGISRKGMAKLHSNGNLDTNYIAEIIGTVNSMVQQPDGKVVIVGNFTNTTGSSRKIVARLNADGSLDSTFQHGNESFGNQIHAICLQPDGKVLIGGDFTSYNGISRNRIARLNADGSIDSTFNPGIGANDPVFAITLQPDGKVLIGGRFNSYAGMSRNKIARLNVNGSLDTTFNPGSGADNVIYSLALQTDGKLLIGGIFTRYNGIYRVNIARVILQDCAMAVTNTTSATSICIGSTKTLSGTPGGSWIIASGSGSIVGSTYTASGGGGTVTVYNLVGGCFSPLVSFQVVDPVVPTTPTPAAICAGNTAVLTPTAGGVSYRFYADSTGGSPLAGGNGVASFTTPNLSNTTTFYISSVNAGGCESSNRTAVTVEVLPSPIINIFQLGDTLKADSVTTPYQWYLDGNVIPGATSRNYLPVQSGVYTVRITGPQGCEGISNEIIVIFAGLEIENSFSNLQWSAYPVPFRQQLTIKAETSFGYQLLDLRGAVLLNGNTEAAQVTLSTGELASGIYLLKITVNGQRFVRKLVRE